MPLISIVTAVLAGKHQYINETYKSLIKQQMPAGWTWQWIVQEDGETGIPLTELADDPRISAGMGTHGRAPMARTTALSRADGILIRALDADDVLPDQALYQDITTLVNHPEAGWCVSPALDLLSDGTLRAGPRDPEPGRLPDRLLIDGEQAGLLPVLGVTMCTYTDLVRILGGWPALRSEDVGLLLAAEAVTPGWMLANPGLYYRRWPSSHTFNIDKSLASEDAPHRSVLIDRANALRIAGWRWTPNAYSRSSWKAGGSSPQPDAEEFSHRPEPVKGAFGVTS